MSAKKTTKPTKPTKPTMSRDTLHVEEDDDVAMANASDHGCSRQLSWRNTVVSWLRDTPCSSNQKDTNLYLKPQRKWKEQGENMHPPTKKLRDASYKELDSAVITDQDSSIDRIHNVLTSQAKHMQTLCSEVQKKGIDGMSDRDPHYGRKAFSHWVLSQSLKFSADEFERYQSSFISLRETFRQDRKNVTGNNVKPT